MLLINFKNYNNGTGNNGIRLALDADKVAREENVNISIAVDFPNIHLVSNLVKIPVFAQHVDGVEPGSKTGYVVAESVKNSGAKGTILNHSEKRLDFSLLEKAVNRSKAALLMTVVCIENRKEIKKVIKMKPDYISLEDPVLIGSGKSISECIPEQIKDCAGIARRHGIIPLCGAGISRRSDVEEAIKLGMGGVMVSSAVVNSENPGKVIRELAKGLKAVV